MAFSRSVSHCIRADVHCLSLQKKPFMNKTVVVSIQADGFSFVCPCSRDLPVRSLLLLQCNVGEQNEKLNAKIQQQHLFLETVSHCVAVFIATAFFPNSPYKNI